MSGSEESLLDFIRRSPLYGLEALVMERDHSLSREDGFTVDQSA